MITDIGAVCFGLVAGFLTYRTVVRSKQTQVSDLTSVLSAIGGGAVTALFGTGTSAFGCYGIGLAAGMIVYFGLFWRLNGRKKAAVVLGGKDEPLPGTPPPGAPR